MNNIKYYYGIFTCFVSIFIFFYTFLNKKSKLINKFSKSKNISLFIHSLGFYIIIILHILNIYFNLYISNKFFLIVYILGLLFVITGIFLGNYALLDGPTVYINYLQVIYIIGLRFILNINNIYNNNNNINDKLSTLIMLNSQPLTRLLAFLIKKNFNYIYNEKEKKKISVSVAQSVIVIGTAPIVFEEYKSTVPIIMLMTFFILCLNFKTIIKTRNKVIKKINKLLKVLFIKKELMNSRSGRKYIK